MTNARSKLTAKDRKRLQSALYEIISTKKHIKLLLRAGEFPHKQCSLYEKLDYLLGVAVAYIRQVLR